jgi:hypothetical protein
MSPIPINELRKQDISFENMTAPNVTNGTVQYFGVLPIGQAPPSWKGSIPSSGVFDPNEWKEVTGQRA